MRTDADIARIHLSYPLDTGLTAFLLAGVGYVGLVAAVLIVRPALSDGVFLIGLHLAAAVSLLVFWRLGCWGTARVASFGAALLLVTILFKIQAIIDTAMFGTRAYEIAPTVPIQGDIRYLYLKAEAISHAGVLLVVLAWRLVLGRDVDAISLVRRWPRISINIVWAMYGLAVVSEFARRIVGIDFGPLAQFSSVLADLGVASILIISARTRGRMSKLLLSGVLALPLALVALRIGMKENILFPFIPAVMLYFYSFRSFAARLSGIALAVAILAVSQLYVQYVRSTSWGLDRQLSTSQLLSRFIAYFPQASWEVGFDSVSSRLNVTNLHAITVAISDTRGFEPTEIFGVIPATFVPRVLWPDKPMLQPGAAHTARIRNIDIPLSEVTTATAAGFFTEMYLGGGYWGLLLGSVGFGVLLGALQKHTTHGRRIFPCYAISFVSVYWAIRLDENHVAYAFTAIIILAVVTEILTRGVAIIVPAGHPQSGAGVYSPARARRY